MITSLKLTNWKSHISSQMSFSPGTNILLGHMGAGKSSILQAISFALFGTFAELKSRGLKISETVSRDASVPNAEIELRIKTHMGLLTIHRRVDAKKNVTEGTVRDESDKLLAGPNPTSVNDFITRTLKIDEAVFLRAVYGMQNEIDSILRLSPGERKKRIDELMGLDKFETARKGAGTLVTRIKTEVDAYNKIVDDLNSEDIQTQDKTLRDELSKLAREKDEIVATLLAKEKEEVTSRTTLEKFREDAKKFEAYSVRIKNSENQISEISTRLMGVELAKDMSEVEKLEVEISSQIEQEKEKKSRFSKSVSEQNDKLMSIEREVAVGESKVKELIRKVGEFQQIEMELESIKSKHGVADFDNEIRKLDSEINQNDEQVKINLAQMETKRRHLNELTSMEGLCPLCKTNLNETDRDSLVSNIKKELAELLLNNNQANDSLSKLREKRKGLEGVVSKYNKNIEDLSNKEKIRSEKNVTEAALEKVVQKRIAVKSEIFKYENLVKEAENRISSLMSKKEDLSKSKYLYELRNRKIILEQELSRLKNEQSSLAIDPNKISQLEETYTSVLRKVQELRTKSEGIGRLIGEKKNRLNEIAAKKERLDSIVGMIGKMKGKIEFLEQFRNALQATQLELRDELILTVNEVMSSVWLEIYPYSTWSGVRLAVDENDYVLQIKDADSDWVNVTGFASGGERMLAALAMRISFARVMVPNLSLLILDEPTHNLDEKAVQTLIEVVQERVAEFLEQILIVTHEEKLAESGNNIIRLPLQG